jgi:hypothetical protein
MKILSAVLFLIFGLTACGRIENFTNLTKQEIKIEKTDDEQPDEPPILEIIHEDTGLSSFPGKSLMLNLYENGVIEFEYRDAEKIKQGKFKTAEEANSLMRAKLAKEELQKFLDLLGSEDFLNAKSEYSNICRMKDAQTNYKIEFQTGDRKKNITLNSYCGARAVRNPKVSNMLDFPKVLSDLISLAETTRVKSFREDSSNQPE